MQGKFITLEGIDGCGKTTQLELLERYLRSKGVTPVMTCEPGGTAIGERVRDLLLDVRHQNMQAATELLLYAADRAQHVREKLVPALERGEVIVCDRHADSTRAYQGSARGLDRALVETLISVATKGLTPHLTLLFDLPVELAQLRRHSRTSGEGGMTDDRLDRERMEFHQRVRDAYLEMARAEPSRFVVIAASGDVEQTWRQVRHAVDDLLGW